MNYIDTFIKVADDCTAKTGAVPTARTEKKTIPVIHYEMLADHPYEYTQEEVLFQTYIKHKEIKLKAGGLKQREEFFSKEQPCLRTSPLAKKYGWGFHFDSKGKVAIYPMESSEYTKFAKQASKVLKALRSSRK